MSGVTVFTDDHSASAVGLISSNKRKGRRTVHLQPTPQKREELNNLLRIKLKRDTVNLCALKSGRSGTFSYDADILGQRIIIWCTGDNGGFCCGYVGTVESSTGHGNRPYMIKIEQKITAGLWNNITSSA